MGLELVIDVTEVLFEILVDDEVNGLLFVLESQHGDGDDVGCFD